MRILLVSFCVLVVSFPLSLGGQSQKSDPAAEYKRRIQVDKNDIAAHVSLYKLYINGGHAGEAEQLLRRAIQASPREYEYRNMLARHYLTTKQPDKLVPVLEQIIACGNEYSDAYMVAGDFYYDAGNTEGAMAAYRLGARDDRGRRAVYQKRMARALLRVGKREDAVAVYAEILQENPNDSEALTGLGGLANDGVTVALAALQGVASGRLSLAKVQAGQGRYEQALKTLADVLRAEPGNVTARLIQSAALMGMKKYAESREVLQGLLAKDANYTEAIFQLGVLNLAEGRYEEAASAFRKCWGLEPAKTRGLMGLVEAYMVQNKPEEAIRILQAEVAKDPGRAEYRLKLGNTAVRAGQYDVGIAAYRKLLDSAAAGEQADLWLRLGETLRRKGDLEGAIAALQNARGASPNSTLILATLALTLDAHGRKKEARNVYEECIRIDPRQGVALNNLAFLLAENGGDLDVALEYSRRARTASPELYEVTDTFGWICLKKNLLDEAVASFREIVQKSPDHSIYRYHLAMALHRKGEDDAARTEAEAALQCKPDADDERKIRELLQTLLRER